MKNFNMVRAIELVISLVLLFFILMGLNGCSPAKIGAKAVETYKASSNFPNDCALQFPPIITKGETKIDTIYGDEIDCDDVVRGYTEFWEGVSTENEKERKALADTIAAMIARGEKPPTKKVRCPPSTHSVRIDTVESTAKLEAANRLNNELRLQYASDTAARNEKQKRTNLKLGNRTSQRNYSFGLNAALIALIGGAIYLKSKIKIG